jgi:hypothetical protein
MLCIFFLIQKLKNKTLKSTSGEIDPARETVSGEIWHREIPSREIFGELPQYPSRESTSVKFRLDPAERFPPERFFGDRWILEREREFPAKSGRDSVERRTAARPPEREICRRDPAKIPSKDYRASKT